jgi:hypothetical protein
MVPDDYGPRDASECRVLGRSKYLREGVGRVRRFPADSASMVGRNGFPEAAVQDNLCYHSFIWLHTEPFLRAMTDIPDYVETLGARIRVGKTDCGVSLKNHGGALFQDIEIAELRSRLNEAIHFAVAHYTECTARAGVEFPRSQIMEVSYRIVIYILVHRDIERRAAHQPRLLYIENADLRSAVAKYLCWIYCESTFPSDYALFAVALSEMSLDQFRQYEYDHRPLMRDMGSLL